MTGRTFAVLSPFVGGDYYGALVAGVNAAAAAQGDKVIAIQTLDPGSHSADHSGLPEFHRPVGWGHVAGLIILPGAVREEYALAAGRAGKPVVLIGHEIEGCSSVVADNRAGVREAVAHLITHGHERIAFAGNLSHFDVRERHEGYREALIAHGITPRADLLFDLPDNHETGGEEVAGTLIQAGMPATAIVFGTDRNAIGLFRRLTAAGYELPTDLAVIGFDDIPDGMYLYPALSTVRQPLDRVGAAAHTLARELADDPTAEHQVRGVPTVFVRRDSCGCPSDGLPVSEPHTRELFTDVQYLHATLNIQYELSIELLGKHGERDPRSLDWLDRTPAVGGVLGLWPPADLASAAPAADLPLAIAGEYRPGGDGPVDVGTSLAVSQFPPRSLFDLADGPANEVVFVVPVKSDARDWGLLAAVGRIQASTPPGREMMNHSGSLLAAALDHATMVQALREQEDRLRNAALHDYLTGLPNRVLLADRLRQAGLRVSRQPSHRFAVLLLDLDGFKAVNDSFGHAAGDELLVEVAARLTGLLRESDTVARLGGDEFVVLLDGVTVPEGPQAVCDAIHSTISRPFVIDGGREVQVGVSIGVAFSAAGAADPDHLLREADAAMYRVKSAARVAR